MLQIQELYVTIEKKEVLHGVTLSIKPGEVHAIMGPNGSGKTSMAMSLMGQPMYKLTGQSASRRTQLKIDEKDVSTLLPEKRAKAGLFVSFQAPIEITGVSFLAFLRTAAKSLRPNEKKPLSAFKEEVKKALKSVMLDESFMHRGVNEGFSGGERKRAEVAQLLVLKPKYAILDEIDSGLDVDSLKLVAKAINEGILQNKTGVLLITHYQRILHFLKPDKVHVLIDGKIKRSGGLSLVRRIEKEGYAAI